MHVFPVLFYPWQRACAMSQSLAWAEKYFAGKIFDGKVFLYKQTANIFSMKYFGQIKSFLQ